MCQLKKPEESFEHALDSIRDLPDLWKMAVAFDTQLRCENPKIFNAFAKSLLHTSQGDTETVKASGKDEVDNECIAKG